MKLLEAVEDSFVVDRMSWRPKMDNAVVYILLKDPRPVFDDIVAGLAVLRPSDESGRVRLGFTREPATDSLLRFGGGPLVTTRVEGPLVLNPIDEQPRVSTNGAAQSQTLAPAQVNRSR